MKKSNPVGELPCHSLHKFLQVMRITILFLVLGIMHGYAIDSYSQKTRLTVDFRETSLAKVLQDLETKSEFYFLYNERLLNVDRNVSLRANDETITAILDRLFAGTDVTYTVLDRKIILAPEFLTETSAQQRSVSGTVRDETGAAMPGVSIQLQGTQTGQLTDADGRYSLQYADDDAVLIFSFIGYIAQDVALNGRSVIDVVLMEDVVNLKEVVVTAFGIEKEKKAISYATQEIEGEKVSAVGNPNILNGLQGKAAGVSVRLNSGMPGKAPQINIRGSRSLTGNNQPLYVIDGLPVAGGDRVTDFNPSDIESFNILKGPAASALYGLRASNGVIVITTKSGRRSRKPTLSFDTHYSIDQVSRLPELQSAYSQGLNGNFDLAQIWSWGARIDEVGMYTNEFGEQEMARAYDNDKAFYKAGGTLNSNVSFADGGESGNYLIGLGYTDQSGIIPGSGMERLNLKFNGETTRIKNLTAGVSLNYSDLDVDDYPELRGNDNYFRGLVDVPPSYNLAGKAYADPNNPFRQLYYRAGQNNPYWAIDHNFRETKTNRTFGSLYFKYKLADGLTANYRIGTDYFNTNRVDFRELGTAPRGRTNPPSGGSVSLVNTSQNQVNSNLFVAFDRNVSEDINLDVIIGNEFYDIRRSSTSGSGSDFVTGNWVSLDNGTNIGGSNSKSTQRTVGFYGNVSLGWKNMLFLNASGRNDIVSNMPSENRSFFYPSVGASFAFSEAFPALDRILTFGKIRATYAEVGQVGPIYVNEDGFVQGSPGGFVFPFNGITGLTQRSTRVNPQLEPENTRTIELGIDLRFFEERIGIDYTFYDNSSEGQIYSVPVPISTGATAEIRNAGAMLSRGHEVTLTAVPLRTTNFEWEIITNFNTFQNTVEELAEGIDRLILSDPIVAEAGHVYPAIYGRSYLRDPASGQIVIDNNVSSATYGFPLTDNNLKVLGTPIPDYEFNFINSFHYKNLTVTAQVDWRQGGVFWNHSLAEANWRGLAIETLDREQDVILEGKQGHRQGTDLVIEGDNNITIKKGWPYYSQLWTNLESQLSDASFVRLREVTLSYSFPRSWFLKNVFSSASLYVTGRNLFLISDAFTDPEINSSESGNENAIGVEYSETPQTRSYGLGIRASF